MNDNFQKGILKRWNDNRGFGFIGLEDGEKDVFIHISALKQMNRRPQVGDVIVFRIQTEKDGKKRAFDASIEGAGEVRSSPGRKKIVTRKNSNRVWVMVVVLIIVLAAVVYKAVAGGNDYQTTSTSSQTVYDIAQESGKISTCAGKTTLFTGDFM